MRNKETKHVLVLCTDNSARSQIAEGLFQALGNGTVVAASAGTEPNSRVNPYAVQVMAEQGYDISAAHPKHLDQYLQMPFDYVITVCDNARESCPLFPGQAERLHWSYPDPAAVEGSDEEKLAAFRAARDGLKQQITALLRQQSA